MEYIKDLANPNNRPSSNDYRPIIVSCVFVLLAFIVTMIIYQNSNDSNADNFDLALPQQTSTPENKTVEENPSLMTYEVNIRNGDNLSQIFNHYGISSKVLFTILSLGNEVSPLHHLSPKQGLWLSFNHDNELIQLELKVNPTKRIAITKINDEYQVNTSDINLESRPHFVSGIIDSSLYLASKKAGVPQKISAELENIFADKINFDRDIRPGDHFTAVFSDYYDGDNKVKTGDILAAEFTSKGKTYKAVRYTDPSGHTDYFTPEGDSLRKAFMRSPITYTRISSSFNLHRKHPILHIVRPHRGVDFAAPYGTPIHAANDGKVKFFGRKYGYGQTIILQHGSRYSTLYGHISRFSHLVKGGYVHKGDVIGYVGKSGLATAPHLHYEFRIHNKPQNPMTVQLPAANPIATKYRDEYKQVAENVLGKLDLYTKAEKATFS